ncbi:class I SAM-dependent methyltransferase [Lapillicoccus sp.]|uniref:class I SAM-dependent methyltransferase n=1 Tax=Lapillicoccus sp. TaxID=1909287 RepID=UPI003264D44B
MSNGTTIMSVPGHVESRWDVVASHAYDAFLAWGEHRGMAQRRAALLAGARGTVLEIGAGTGLNLAAYPPVDRLLLSEPALTMRGHLVRRVADQTAAAVVLDAHAESLPVPTGSVDTVVSTMVLCTVPDLDAALAEVVRVLRVGGRFLFVEHVAAPEGTALRRWQERLVEPWAVFAMGCRCDRDVLGAISHHLIVDRGELDAWRGMPPVVRPLVVGQATRPAD